MPKRGPKGPSRPLDYNDLMTAHFAYMAGVGSDSLAESLRVSRPTLLLRFGEAGLTVRPQGRPPAAPGAVTSLRAAGDTNGRGKRAEWARKRDEIRQALSAGELQTEIAARLGVTRQRISQIKVRMIGRRPALTPEERQRLQKESAARASLKRRAERVTLPPRECRNCSRTFTPSRPTQVNCCRRCTNASKARNYRRKRKESLRTTGD